MPPPVVPAQGRSGYGEAAGWYPSAALSEQRGLAPAGMGWQHDPMGLSAEPGWHGLQPGVPMSSQGPILPAPQMPMPTGPIPTQSQVPLPPSRLRHYW